MTGQILTVLISSIVSLIVALITIGLGFWRFKVESIYKRKQEAIKDALMFINDYISVLDMSSGVPPICRDDLTKESLTFRARECYENLCISCKSKEVPELFVNIIFNEGKIFEVFLEFRNAARKELGLRKIEQDKERVFFSIVSSRKLG